MIHTLTPTQQQQTQKDQRAPHRDQRARAEPVKDGPDLDADEEDDEQVQAEDPANLGRRLVDQLVRRKVRLEHGRRVDQPEQRDHGAEGAQHHKPARQTALGEVDGRRSRGLERERVGRQVGVVRVGGVVGPGGLFGGGGGGCCCCAIVWEACVWQGSGLDVVDGGWGNRLG